jgi:hypothetical protein
MMTYLRIVLSLVIVASVYGVLVPTLISMKDTLSLTTGLALAFITPPCLYFVLKGIFISKDKK